MKITCCFVVVVALLALVSVVRAEDTIKYAGTTDGAPSWTLPAFDSNTGACISSSSPTTAPYVVFNYTYSTSGVRQVVAMAEKNFKPAITVYIYAGAFAPATPCGNFYDYVRNSGGVPPVDDAIYFVGGQLYSFVISSKDGSANITGKLAINIFPGVEYGATTADSPVWPIASQDSTGACQPSSSGNFPQYGTFTWTQQDTGRFDIGVYFYNNTAYNNGWSYTYLALYNGNFSDPSNLTDPCSPKGATFANATYNNYQRTSLYYIQLVAGQTYSVAFSGYDNTDYGYFEVQVVPTRLRFPNSLPYFVQPVRDTSASPDCVASTSYNQAAWDAVVFTAEQRVYILDTGSLPNSQGYFDSYSFMYRGLNAGNATATPAVAPQTCPSYADLVFMGDTGDVTPMVTYTDINKTYTVVVSTYSGSDLDDGSFYAYILYAFTGLPIGDIPPSNTTGSTTGGQSTGQSTGGATTRSSTGALTTGKVTSTTTGGRNTTGTTSAASTLVLSSLVLFSVVVAML